MKAHSLTLWQSAALTLDHPCIFDQEHTVTLQPDFHNHLKAHAKRRIRLWISFVNLNAVRDYRNQKEVMTAALESIAAGKIAKTRQECIDMVANFEKKMSVVKKLATPLKDLCAECFQPTHPKDWPCERVERKPCPICQTDVHCEYGCVAVVCVVCGTRFHFNTMEIVRKEPVFVLDQIKWEKNVRPLRKVKMDFLLTGLNAHNSLKDPLLADECLRHFLDLQIEIGREDETVHETRGEMVLNHVLDKFVNRSMRMFQARDILKENLIDPILGATTPLDEEQYYTMLERISTISDSFGLELFTQTRFRSFDFYMKKIDAS